MVKWQAIVFDLDDTLYPEQSYVLSGFRAVADHFAPQLGIDPSQGFDSLKTLFLSGIRGNTFNLWLNSYGAPAAWVPDAIEVYRSHIPNITPFPEVPSLLKQLQSSFKIGLISDGYIAVQEKKWKALGLDTYFDVRTFSDRWGREHWKPSVKPFLHTQSELDAKAIVYVADNPLKDFYGARQCKWRTIRIRCKGTEYANYEPPEPDYAPDLTIYSLNDLENALNRLESWN